MRCCYRFEKTIGDHQRDRRGAQFCNLSDRTILQLVKRKKRKRKKEREKIKEKKIKEKYLLKGTFGPEKYPVFKFSLRSSDKEATDYRIEKKN